MIHKSRAGLMPLLVFACVLLGRQALAQYSGELTDWQLSLDQGKSFRPIHVPGAVEDRADLEFDGVSIFKAKLPPLQLTESQRLLLHFQAVATDAKVYFDNRLVGQHLGGWTPFAIDLTNELRKISGDKDHEAAIRVEVDEKVGHNTQGFLPIIINHFGGIWQPVTWELTDRAVILDNAVAVRADFLNQQLVIETPVLHGQSDQPIRAYSIRPLRPAVANPTAPGNPWQSSLRPSRKQSAITLARLEKTMSCRSILKSSRLPRTSNAGHPPRHSAMKFGSS